MIICNYYTKHANNKNTDTYFLYVSVFLLNYCDNCSIIIKFKYKEVLATDTRKVLSYINANDDLKYYFNYYMNYNISYDNPYHNMSHTIKVLNNIINISEEMKIDNFNL